MKFKILMFSLLFCLMFCTVGFASSYPSDLPPVPETFEIDGITYPVQASVIVSDSQGYFLRLLYCSSEGKFINDMEPNNDFVRIHHSSGNKFAYRGYRLSDGVWNSVSSDPSTPQQGFYTTFATPVFSTFDLVDANGEVFFSAPVMELYQTIQKVTEQGLATELTLAGTIRVLVLCGVGLIALLMVLNLFGRVFNLYRS